MLVPLIIAKKRDGRELTKEEISFLVSGFTKGEIPDYQMSAFLMAGFLSGFSPDETLYLTGAMLDSGEKIDLSSLPQPKIDKHSTGGVGDKVSLILAPLVSACGVTVPMISGRSLGHTGGTLDKLESIPGFRTNLSLSEFKENLGKVGLCLIGQTDRIAPADKKIYALRDVTGTVESVPLITASILSKKLAEGAEGLVFDVKVGSGAFMSDYKRALRLAKSLIQAGSKFKTKMSALLTDMSEPLGEAVGNSLEVIEAIEALKGRWKEDLKIVTYGLGAEMLMMAGIAKNYKEAVAWLHQANSDGRGLARFQAMVDAQGGDPGIVTDYSKLPKAEYILTATSPSRGFIREIKTRQIGLLAIQLGAGRKTMDSRIDHAAGVLIKRKIGGKIERGEMLAEVHSNDPGRGREVAEQVRACFIVSSHRVRRPKKLWGRLTLASKGRVLALADLERFILRET